MEGAKAMAYLFSISYGRNSTSARRGTKAGIRKQQSEHTTNKLIHIQSGFVRIQNYENGLPDGSDTGDGVVYHGRGAADNPSHAGGNASNHHRQSGDANGFLA